MQDTTDQPRDGELIAQLISAANPDHIRPSTNQNSVVQLASRDFDSLDSFKEAYMREESPVFCLITESETSEVLQWLRKTDDFALEGESQELTDWRIRRIADANRSAIDPISKLSTRGGLAKALSAACKTATSHQPVSLILLDVDRFKSLNDRNGGDLSNEMLGELGQLVQSLCPNTLVGRTRGGEFGILIHVHENVCQTIAQILKERISVNQWCIPESVTASFGIATALSKTTASTILTNADEALFAAKAHGRNMVVAYSDIAAISNRNDDERDVVSMENKAKVMSERVTSFVAERSKRIIQDLRQAANTDGLTQLFNRGYLDKRLEKEFNLAIASQSDFCVALIDVDHFGEVNKNYGWPAGDQVLKSIANTISGSIRGTDWVARYGGEEICVVMPKTNLHCAKIACERIRSAVESNGFKTDSGESINITLSAGVVNIRHQTDRSPSDLIERLSDYTLKAKSEGRNRVCSEL